jgi:hypothetical protein
MERPILILNCQHSCIHCRESIDENKIKIQILQELYDRIANEESPLDYAESVRVWIEMKLENLK